MRLCLSTTSRRARGAGSLAFAANLTIVLDIKTISDGGVIHQGSRRLPRAIDFCRVEGMVNVNDIGMLLTAIAGALPTMVTADIVSPNGVAVRLVGIGVRIVMVALAALSKFTTILLIVPAPVSGASQMLALGILFVSGWQTIVHDGLDSRRILAIGLASALGLGIQGHPVTRDIVGDELGALLGSGFTIGAIVGAITVHSTKRYCSKARAHAARAVRLHLA